MRTTDALWHRCQSGDIDRADWTYEKRIKILDVIYTEDDLIKIEVTKGCVQDSFSLGNTISSELRTTVIPPREHEVYYDAKVLYEVRIITRNDGETPWYEFGHFYIKEATQVNDSWQLVCYDRLSRLNRQYKGADSSTTQAALNNILVQLGITLDPRSQVNSFTGNITGLKEYTYREILGFIGSLNAGNWIITESNQLRLIRPELSTPLSIVNADNTKKLMKKLSVTYDRVSIKTGTNSEKEITAGTGPNEFEVLNPWATQATADLILNQLANFEINPEDTQSSEMDVALEIGDTIEVSGRPVQLMSVDYSGQLYMSVNTPVEPETYNKGRFTIGGGDGGGTDPEDKERIEVIEELLDSKGCILIKKADLDLNSRYTHDISKGTCVILSSDIDKVMLRVPIDSDKVRFKGGIGVVDYNSCFINSSKENIDITSLVTKSATTVESMFYNLKADSDISGKFELNLSSAENLRAMFDNATLPEYTTLNYELGRAKSLESSFRNMKSIKTLDMRRLDLSTVEVFDYTFSNNATLSEVIFNRSFDLDFVKKARRMFRNSTALTSIKGGANFVLDGKKTGYYQFDLFQMFENCSNLEELDFNIMGNVVDVSFTSMFKGCAKLKKIDLSNLIATMPSSGAWGSNIGSMQNMFEGCEALEEIKLPAIRYPHENESRLWNININHAFKNTPNLKSDIDLRNLFASRTYSAIEPLVNCGAPRVFINAYSAYANRVDDTDGLSLFHLSLKDPANNPNDIPIRVVPNPANMHPNLN